MSEAPESTTTTQPFPHGGGATRGLRLTPSSSNTTGRFGRMFRRLPVYEHKRKYLDELGRTMIEPHERDRPLGETDVRENRSTFDGELRLPAGYTYFGQLVDHDITWDRASTLDRQNDPDALTDFRTPCFDLDSLYGGGPAMQPYLYRPGGVKLELGEPRSDNDEVAGPDLPRAANGRALIGDPRNDQNLIISQLQVAFIKFHNAVVAHVRETNRKLGKGDLFKLAQQTVRWHYQWVVIQDFLRRLVGDDVMRDILRPNDYRTPGGRQTTIRPRLLFYRWKEQPFMPVEFSVAAYRYGHSMARTSYLINDVIRIPVVDDAHRIPLFSQEPRNGGQPTSLNGFGPLPNGWGIQWKYFLHGIEHTRGPNDDHLPQPSYWIDTKLSHPLGELPEEMGNDSLAVRNLRRGWALGLPAGQDVARAMGITPLAEDLLADIRISRKARRHFYGRWPLWFYILKEAEVETGGAHLGPVGGRIVAEVLIGLLAGDPLSYLSVNPTWKPTLPSRTPGTFTLTDLINFGL